MTVELVLVCDECLEPTAEPADGDHLDMCEQCCRTIPRKAHQPLVGLSERERKRRTGKALYAWQRDVHYRAVIDGFVCNYCPSEMVKEASLRKHLTLMHRHVFEDLTPT